MAAITVEMTTQAEDSVTVTPRTIAVEHCPLCWAKGSRILFELEDKLHGIPGKYTYRRCMSCRTVFQDPRVVADDLHLCYPSQYYTHIGLNQDSVSATETEVGSRHFKTGRDAVRDVITAAVQGGEQAWLLNFVGRALATNRDLRERAFHNHVIDELIPRTSGSSRALDVGCGAGWFTRALKSVGWQAEGVEPDPDAARVARRVAACHVWEGDFLRMDLPLGTYNLITLNHVFEHLDDPVQALRRIGELLAPGGRAVLIYPNPESLGARLYGKEWFPWEAPRHLVLPPPRALAGAGRKAGLLAMQFRATARSASHYFTQSRLYAKKELPKSKNAMHSFTVRLLGFIERMLVAIGFDLGEEIIAVLLKPRNA